MASVDVDNVVRLPGFAPGSGGLGAATTPASLDGLSPHEVVAVRKLLSLMEEEPLGVIGTVGSTQEHGPTAKSKHAMDDKDVSRLEERIAHSEERSTLRLEAAMAKLDGKFELVVNSLHDLRNEGRQTRSLVLTVGIGSAVTVLFGVLGILIGLQQFWGAGVQVGQTLQQAAQQRAEPSPPAGGPAVPAPVLPTPSSPPAIAQPSPKPAQQH